MNRRRKLEYFSKKGWKSYLKFRRRIERKRRRKAGLQRHRATMKRRAEMEGRGLPRPSARHSRFYRRLPPKPDYSENIKYLLNVPELFSKRHLHDEASGNLKIPKCFSLIENYEESFDFLKKLFVRLQKHNNEEIVLDYIDCERIDVDASICMDVMLAEFIAHFYNCRRIGYRDEFKGAITPINYERDEIKKVLFSIGAYRNIRGFHIDYHDVEDLPVLINDHNDPTVWQKSEVDLTKIVEYIKKCLFRLNRFLTPEAENEFYKVIGEIMSNALEHGTMRKSYSIGFFQETQRDNEHYGVFNFSIFNFGDTIYQTFKREDCPNKRAVNQMAQLADIYTNKGWFKKAAFEEETLWTLYALQEGVTSKEKKRGNGSIQYIENFFKLKGDLSRDDVSKLVILSGNTRILFDGSYKITLKRKEGEKRNFKMITFNNSGDIAEQPDKKFVTFAPHFFPGTMISARILIKFDNTDDQ